MHTAKLMALMAVWLLVSMHPASAYIGPGAGAGTIAVVFGILAAIIMAFFGLLWYPVKRLLKKRRTTRADATREPHANE